MTKQLLIISAGLALMCSFLWGSPFNLTTDNLVNAVPGIYYDLPQTGNSELFGPFSAKKTLPLSGLGKNEPPSLPQSVLVMMVEFDDVRFQSSLTNPDFLANPEYTVKDFVERNMFHLQSYYLDVSRDRYQLNYTVLDSIITLPNPMSYYGDRNHSLEQRVKLIEEVISSLDEVVDFSLYDAFMIQHAGAGRETDIYGTNPDTIPSSFITRILLQYVLDPDNDDFPGIATNDGVHIQEVVIASSHQNHADTPEANYGVQGVLSYLFGRQIGLPTLFGNVSSLGRAAGAGNFCLMGTGSWNANGYVPPFLSAWSRYFMGWDEPVLINNGIQDLLLSYPFNDNQPDLPTLYKIPISAEEYYLVENRQQNPDGSTLNGWPNFTFRLLPEDEQDYYDPPNHNIPRFNFMKNTYRGCEWDYYLPGLGEMEESISDGSGILIWHIDESVIRENYETNTINAIPTNQGVTLQEADGIQHLQSGIPDIYMRGSPFDSFRAGHNDYFGYMTAPDGTISIPYSQSKYGVSDIEIHSIGYAEPVMNLSVELPYNIDLDYSGIDFYPLAIVNDFPLIDGRSSLNHTRSKHHPNKTRQNRKEALETIFLATESGKIFLLQDQELIASYPATTDSIPHLYAYSPNHQAFFVPAFSVDNSASLLKVSQSGVETQQNYPNYSWATHPLITHSTFEDDWRLVLALNSYGHDQSRIIFYDSLLDLKSQIVLPAREVTTNLTFTGDYIYFLSKKQTTEDVSLARLDIGDMSLSLTTIPELSGKKLNSLLSAPLNKEIDSDGSLLNNFTVLTIDDELYLLENDGSIAVGFPVTLPEKILSVPSFQDITGNGYLDILLVSSNSLFVVGYNGEILTFPIPSETSYPSQTNAPLGAVAFDYNGDGKNEIFATLGGHSLVVWDSAFKLQQGYPLMFSNQVLHSPVFSSSDDALVAYLTSQEGKIFRYKIPESNPAMLNSLQWSTEFGNLQRTANYGDLQLNNKYQTSDLFVNDECYFFPNPVTYQNGGTVYFNLMTNSNISVSVKIFDISGKLIFKEKYDCQAYISNRNKLALDITSLSSGVYFAVLQAGKSVKKLSFAVEK
jgi:M6 family metalloprotease-like protein